MRTQCRGTARSIQLPQTAAAVCSVALFQGTELHMSDAVLQQKTQIRQPRQTSATLPQITACDKLTVGFCSRRRTNLSQTLLNQNSHP